MKTVLDLHVRIHRWVMWWMIFGVVCGVVAVTNILEHNLTRTQERTLIAMGIMNWMLGGLVCYACEGIQIEEAPPARKRQDKTVSGALPGRDGEWYSASDLLLPGDRKSILPPKYR